jgi:hypothetical protein
MPTTVEFVFAPDDEKHFCAFLAPWELTAYPDRVPPDWEPFVVNAENAEKLTHAGYYLAAERMGPLVMHAVKKGKDKGTFQVAEVDSPVIHYQRSYVDEKGELRSGRLWAELNLTGDMQLNPAFPDAFRRLLIKIKEHLQTRCMKSTPAGWLIGPGAARMSKAGVLMRAEGRTGGPLKPYK